MRKITAGSEPKSFFQPQAIHFVAGGGGVSGSVVYAGPECRANGKAKQKF